MGARTRAMIGLLVMGLALSAWLHRAPVGPRVDVGALVSAHPD
jgi:hypothetical protein